MRHADRLANDSLIAQFHVSLITQFYASLIAQLHRTPQEMLLSRHSPYGPHRINALA